ncbi:MAG: UDP-N-acetylglucosamine 1-carboxyvinyltransferase [Gammaproteobacteria bacterium]|nr:UDP-N-acetylglucosamine 1-carboxyvinyltransferase [Gammaproteobacteria bacterium]
MDKLEIEGGRALAGEVRISGAKNSVLPIMAACLLTAEPVRIRRAPDLRDVATMARILRAFGAEVERTASDTLEVQMGQACSVSAPYDLVKTMRASFFVLGPLLARFGEAEAPLPGGCAIGTRPVDQHLKGLEALGATLDLHDGYVCMTAPPGGLVGSDVRFDRPTVGGTENLMMAACLASGTTRISNAAREPEVIDLAKFLLAMGASIRGQGTDQITVQGAERLSGADFFVMPDRIETATYLIAGAATRGRVRACGTDAGSLASVLHSLAATGGELDVGDSHIEINMRGRRPRPVDIRTSEHPGFPTDAQAQFLALNCVADGASTVEETIFENRFMHVAELVRLGAVISGPRDNSVHVQGVPQLHGAPVMATDLRASFSLVIAGLAAEGTTLIDRIYHIDRGYEAVEDKLLVLGGRVRRVH